MNFCDWRLVSSLKDVVPHDPGSLRYCSDDRKHTHRACQVEQACQKSAQSDISKYLIDGTHMNLAILHSSGYDPVFHIHSF